MYCTAAIRGLKPKDHAGMERRTSGELYATPACDADNHGGGGGASDNAGEVWLFCNRNSATEREDDDGGGRYIGIQKRPVTTTRSLDSAPTSTGRMMRDRIKEEEKDDETIKPLMNEQHQEMNGGPKMVKGVEDLNIDNRDPVSMSSHVRIGFEEVFAEPDGQQSFDAIWTTSFIVYTQSKTWCYRILSAMLAIPLALLWGMQFAFLTFCHIWWVAPCIRAWLVTLHWIGRFWAICVRTFCDPINDSCSRLLGNIKVHTHHPQHV